VSQVTAARRREQQAMRNYIKSQECLMAFLRRELDDDGDRPCGRCANCAGPALPTTVDDELVAAAADHLRQEPLQIGVRKQWPAGLGLRTGKIPEDRRPQEGRALCRAGRAGWATLVERGVREGHFDERLIRAARDLVIRRWDPDPPPEWVTWIPSASQPGVVEDLAQRLAIALDLPAVQAVQRVRQRPSQRTRRNSIQQAANVVDAFAVCPQLPAGPVLMVDDLVDSGWTFTVVANAVRAAGGGPIHPFALVTAAHG
jgi:ATP-dependent DNA helicase RecQ